MIFNTEDIIKIKRQDLDEYWYQLKSLTNEINYCINEDNVDLEHLKFCYTNCIWNCESLIRLTSDIRELNKRKEVDK